MASRINRREGWYIAVPFFTCCYLLFWNLGSPALYDLDEGGYAEIAREMLVLNDWIVPHLNFVRLLDKPPLLYWLTALSYQLFGISEFAARLPVALSALGCTMLCYLLGKRFFGSLAGFLSALIFATGAGTIAFDFGRQLQPDMVFTFFLTAAFGALLLGYFEPEKKKKYYLLGYAAMALAVMTKGLIGLVFPFLAVAGYLCLTREFGIIRQLQLLRGTLLFLLLTLPWHLLAELKSPGFLKFYLLDVHILRFFHDGMIASNGASLPLPAFWAVTALLLYPWAVFLPLAFLLDFPFRLQSSEDSDKAALWLWLWVGTVIVFFSVSSFRLYIYGLPALPALAILAGRFWAKVLVGGAFREPAGSARNAEKDVRCRSGILAATILIVLVAGGILLASQIPDAWQQRLGRDLYGMVDADLSGYYKEHTSREPSAGSEVVSLPTWKELSPVWVLGGTVLFAGGLLALLATFMNRFTWAFAFMILTMFPISYCTQAALEIFEPHKSSRSLAMTIASTLQPGEKIVKDGRYEPIASVSFYTGQKIYLVHGIRNDLVFGSRYPESAEIFLDEERFLQLWSSETRVYLLTDYPMIRQPYREALYGKLKLYSLDRSGGIQLFTNHPL